MIEEWNSMMYYFKIKRFTSYIVHTINLKVRIIENKLYISRIITSFFKNTLIKGARVNEHVFIVVEALTSLLQLEVWQRDLFV
jgi:hypothetical protein